MDRSTSWFGFSGGDQILARRASFDSRSDNCRANSKATKEVTREDYHEEIILVRTDSLLKSRTFGLLNQYSVDHEHFGSRSLPFIP